jgi:integrase
MTTSHSARTRYTVARLAPSVAAVVLADSPLAVSAHANPKAVQTMLGHKSAAMTLDTYADLFPDDLELVSNALDQLRSSDLGTCQVPVPA